MCHLPFRDELLELCNAEFKGFLRQLLRQLGSESCQWALPKGLPKWRVLEL
jgi:hypothetical protein